MIGALARLNLLEKTTIRAEVGPASAEITLVRDGQDFRIDLEANAPGKTHSASETMSASAGALEQVKYVAPLLRSAMDFVGVFQGGHGSEDGVDVVLVVEDNEGRKANRTFRLPVEKSQLAQLGVLVQQLREVSAAARAVANV